MLRDFTNKRLVIISVVLVLAIIIIPLSVSYLSRIGKSPITLVVSPVDSTIRLDGKKLSNGKNYITPGTYSLEVSREEFTSIELPIEIKDGDNPDFPVLLTPSTEKGWAILRDDPNVAETERAAGEEAARRGDEFTTNNPIVENLPYRHPDFNIDYKLKSDDPTAVAIVITASSRESRGLALNQIRAWGFNPANLEIEYLDW